MLYLPISRSWLFSPAARRIYLLCALLALGLIATEIGVHMAMSAAGTGKLTPAGALVRQNLALPRNRGHRPALDCDVVFLVWLRPLALSEKSVMVCVLVFFSAVRNAYLLFCCLSSLRFSSSTGIGPEWLRMTELNPVSTSLSAPVFTS